MKKTEMRRIWTWITSQLDTRLVTNVAVGAVLGLVALEVLKLVVSLAGAVVGVLMLMLFSAC